MTCCMSSATEFQDSDAQLVDFLSEFHAGGNISAAAAVVNTLHLEQQPGVPRSLRASGPEADFDLVSMEQVLCWITSCVNRCE